MGASARDTPVVSTIKVGGTSRLIGLIRISRTVIRVACAVFSHIAIVDDIATDGFYQVLISTGARNTDILSGTVACGVTSIAIRTVVKVGDDAFTETRIARNGLALSVV